MNARSQTFELTSEGRQVEDVVTSIFHALLFHRTLGKFKYQGEGYSVGTVGYEDVDCNFLDFTYVRCASDELDYNLKRDISPFCEALRNSDGPRSGQISLEFYQKKRSSVSWLFSSPECIPWEVWSIKVNIATLNNEYERNNFREEVREKLAEKILNIAQVINKPEYVPVVPVQSELDLTFDTSYPNVQPYLYRISHQTNGPSNTSVGTTVKKLLRDTLQLT